MTKQEAINKAEKECEHLYNRYELMLEFYPEETHESLHNNFIDDLNTVLNNVLIALGVSYYVDKENWHNILDKERQGIARDKLSNINRVIRTEVQEAYNTHLNELWEKDDRIVGRRISLSKSGKNHCEICKNMVGVYPLSFVWTKFHINCLCEQKPVYGTKIPKFPNRAKKFVELNRHRFEKWSSKPDWLEYF